MATANPRYGRIFKGHTIPYGTLADASYELKQAYYAFGYLHDEDMPELPVWEPEPVEADPVDAVHQQDLVRVVQEVLDTLPPRESKILRLRYGVELTADYTLAEVGNRYDLSQERIRQLETKALRRLKNPYRYEVLRKLIEDEPRRGPGKLNNPK